MITAAWLHDIVEDTDVSMQQVRELFGEDTALLVEGLTDPEEFSDMPVAERKQLQADRIALLPEDVKRIKLADQLSNVGRILHRPPTDWTQDKQLTYVKGAAKIAAHCRGLWPELDERFAAACRDALKKFAQHQSGAAQKK